MEYSNYTLDQLMVYKGYQEMCNRFLNLAKDQETKSILETILYKGGYANYKPSSPIGKNNPLIEIQKETITCISFY